MFACCVKVKEIRIGGTWPWLTDHLHNATTLLMSKVKINHKKFYLSEDYLNQNFGCVVTTRITWKFSLLVVDVYWYEIWSQRNNNVIQNHVNNLSTIAMCFYIEKIKYCVEETIKSFFKKKMLKLRQCQRQSINHCRKKVKSASSFMQKHSQKLASIRSHDNKFNEFGITVYPLTIKRVISLMHFSEKSTKYVSFWMFHL